MSSHPARLPAEAFFLNTPAGQRFCLFHSPDPDQMCRGALIFFPPFGDEMNKSRRMITLQARALSAAGFGVLQIDLLGCGDSSGEFGDARWQLWKQDMAAAWQWLKSRTDAPVSLWGLRLGALLALDFTRDSINQVDKIILWQPVTSGESFLTRFLRLRLASEALADDATPTRAGGGTNALRAAMTQGEVLEIAGYELSPELAAAIDSLKAAELTVIGCPVHWFEITTDADRALLPAVVKVADAWKQQQVDLHLHTIQGPPFWIAQEIAECSDLIAATTCVITGQ